MPSGCIRVHAYIANGNRGKMGNMRGGATKFDTVALGLRNCGEKMRAQKRENPTALIITDKVARTFFDASTSPPD